MRSRILWVGRSKERDPESLLATRYLDRINHFLPMDQLAVKPWRAKSAVAETQKRESDAVLRNLHASDAVILCDERGKQLDSTALAQLLGDHLARGTGRLIWIVGGASGVSPGLRQRADFVLSLSRMTLPHALARVVLLEQIYRACCIRAHHPYHHEGT